MFIDQQDITISYIIVNLQPFQFQICYFRKCYSLSASNILNKTSCIVGNAAAKAHLNSFSFIEATMAHFAIAITCSSLLLAILSYPSCMGIFPRSNIHEKVFDSSCLVQGFPRRSNFSSRQRYCTT